MAKQTAARKIFMLPPGQEGEVTNRTEAAQKLVARAKAGSAALRTMLSKALPKGVVAKVKEGGDTLACLASIPLLRRRWGTLVCFNKPLFESVPSATLETLVNVATCDMNACDEWWKKTGLMADDSRLNWWGSWAKDKHKL